MNRILNDERKMDLSKIKEFGLTMELLLTLIYIETKRLGKDYPGEKPSLASFIALSEKGFVDLKQDGVVLTRSGAEAYGNIMGISSVKFNINNIKHDFNEFWEAFPASDAHGKWSRTRGLRSEKDVCESLYKTHIKNGISHDLIIEALRWQVNDFKRLSTNRNQLSFMKNSATWLRRKEFEVIAELINNERSTNSNVDWTETVL